MIIYHGSTVLVEKPEIRISDSFLDFGTGFYTIHRFDRAGMEWLQFVVRNRRGETPEKMFDMHIGPVADDNVYSSIRLFETGVLDADETVKRLKTEVLQDQWTFHTEKMLSYIRFIDSKEIRTEEQ